MHIGVLSTQLGTPGGPATFDRRVLQHIAAVDHENQYTIYALTEHAKHALAVGNGNFRIRAITPPGKWLGLAFGVALEMKRRPVDLLHASFVPPPYVPGRFVMTMTCWSQYTEPELYPPLVRLRIVYLLNRGIPRSSAVFCYTDFLKQKVVEKFDYDPERIFVTPPGIGEEMRRVTDRSALDAYLQGVGIEGPYVLFIGALTKRKNVHRLVEAYARVIHEAKLPHKLVLVGEKLFDATKLDESIEKSGLKDRIVFVGQRPHEELPWLYSGADLYVFPTLSEGFGLTPLEAMACGTPVVASNVTSVPEVVADAAVPVDPTSVDEIAAGIHKCLTDEPLRSALIEKGYANAAKYNWDATAHKMIAAYKTVLDNRW
jgi:glycosyltransferase involved in cell wall biosynthesis